MMTLKEGGRVSASDGMEPGGMHYKAPLGSGHLHPSNPDPCFKCPQYHQAIIYPRKCYYEKQCGLPVFIQRRRLNRILRKKIDETKWAAMGMQAANRHSKFSCPDDKHNWGIVVNQPGYMLSICQNCGELDERRPGKKYKCPACEAVVDYDTQIARFGECLCDFQKPDPETGEPGPRIIHYYEPMEE
jgi:hypothetical protein